VPLSFSVWFQTTIFKGNQDILAVEVEVSIRVASVGNRVASVDSLVALVGNQVASVDNLVASVGNQVALVDILVASMGILAASMGILVASVDSQVGVVENKPSGSGFAHRPRSEEEE